LPWWGWIVTAGVLGSAELLTPGSYLVWIALGASVTALAERLLDLPLGWQLGIFAAASSASCALGYRVYRHSDRSKPAPVLNERDRDMIGARGIVCESIGQGEGRVRLGDSVWRAEGPALTEGTHVVVKKVQGLKVIVEPVER
jgi:inner membrane protein